MGGQEGGDGGAGDGGLAPAQARLGVGGGGEAVGGNQGVQNGGTHTVVVTAADWNAAAVGTRSSSGGGGEVHLGEELPPGTRS